MIQLKVGVLFGEGVHTALLRALAAAGEVFDREGLPCVVTSLRDGRHKRGSLHYAGHAADLRTKHVPRADLHRVVNAVRAVLGEDYDVILEAEGEMNEHLHIEFDPKS